MPGVVGEEFAHVVKSADIDSGIRARRFAESGLIHEDDLAEAIGRIDRFLAHYRKRHAA